MEPKRLRFWQMPEYSPIIYGLGTFLLAEGVPVIEFVIDYLTSAPGSYTFETFLRGLGLALMVALLAWAKNRGKSTVTLSYQRGTGDGMTTTTGESPDISAGSQVTILKP